MCSTAQKTHRDNHKTLSTRYLRLVNLVISLYNMLYGYLTLSFCQIRHKIQTTISALLHRIITQKYYTEILLQNQYI